MTEHNLAGLVDLVGLIDLAGLVALKAIINRSAVSLNVCTGLLRPAAALECDSGLFNPG